VAGMEQFVLKSIARSFNITDLKEKKVPTDEDVGGIVAQRVVASLEAELRSRDSLEKERMRRFIPLGRSLTEAEEESPLIAMLLDDYYQRTLQAAPQSPSGETAEEEPAALTVEPAPVGRSVPGDKKKRIHPRRSGRDRGRERTRHPA
ncbi:MAG: ATP-dependent helicase, partial [Proteobacteria bacterium]|nr:ATP-dependent helicase [Pseudomonadota bacterium]